MNYFFIKWWGPMPALRGFLRWWFHPACHRCPPHDPGCRCILAACWWTPPRWCSKAFVLLAETPLYGLWTGIITALIVLYNFAGVGPWPCPAAQLLGRRGKQICDRRLDRTQESIIA